MSLPGKLWNERVPHKVSQQSLFLCLCQGYREIIDAVLVTGEKFLNKTLGNQIKKVVKDIIISWPHKIYAGNISSFYYFTLMLLLLLTV